MKTLKKIVASATLMAMFASTAALSAQDEVMYADNVGGCGYNEGRTCSQLAPAIALATIGVVAIIAVAVQNRSHSGHGHSH
jgi:hypothetical protein